MSASGARRTLAAWRPASPLPFAVALFLCTGALAAAADADMRELSRRASCDACHEAPVRPGASQPQRVAPSWRDIAARYAADPDAERKLVRVVLAGTGPLPGNRHWRGNAHYAEMPNNDVQISASDARRLVRWILVTPH